MKALCLVVLLGCLAPVALVGCGGDDTSGGESATGGAGGGGGTGASAGSGGSGGSPDGGATGGSGGSPDGGATGGSGGAGATGGSGGSDASARDAAGSGGSAGSDGSVGPKDGSSDALANLCAQTGGAVVTQSCCTRTSDFPNTCMMGACNCEPVNSHDVQYCQCPTADTGDTLCFMPTTGCGPMP